VPGSVVLLVGLVDNDDGDDDDDDDDVIVVDMIDVVGSEVTADDVVVDIVVVVVVDIVVVDVADGPVITKFLMVTRTVSETLSRHVASNFAGSGTSFANSATVSFGKVQFKFELIEPIIVALINAFPSTSAIKNTESTSTRNNSNAISLFGGIQIGGTVFCRRESSLISGIASIACWQWATVPE